MFYSLQGEGARAGRAAVFCRFSKCNLWNGREASRAQAICNFCDTDFIGTDGHLGGRYTSGQLVEIIQDQWPGATKGEHAQGKPYVVCTGGEPALQLDKDLVLALQNTGFEVAIETNGTLPLPDNIDWVCLSPKGDSELVVIDCDELKLVYPQPLAPPERFLHIQARHYFLSPMASPSVPEGGPDAIKQSNTRKATDYCLAHPQWRLTLQMHKILGID